MPVTSRALSGPFSLTIRASVWPSMYSIQMPASSPSRSAP
jgi:hypothetical protein